MTLPRINVPRLRVDQVMTGPDGKPTTAFTRYFNDIIEQLATDYNRLADHTNQIEAALTQAGIALTTATTEKKKNAIALSYTDPGAILSSTVSTADATKATITVAAHNRVYADGTSVAVGGGTIDLLTQGALYYVYYDQASRAGGTVTYAALTGDTAYLDAGQTGIAPHADRHACGSLTTAASGGTGTTYGGGPRPSGTGGYQGLENEP